MVIDTEVTRDRALEWHERQDSLDPSRYDHLSPRAAAIAQFADSVRGTKIPIPRSGTVCFELYDNSGNNLGQIGITNYDTYGRKTHKWHLYTSTRRGEEKRQHFETRGQAVKHMKGLLLLADAAGMSLCWGS